MITNKTIWIMLISFTLIGYYLSDSSLSGVGLVIVIMLLYSIKFISISFQFMEMKKAHSAWRFIILSILVIFVSLITVAYTIWQNGKSMNLDEILKFIQANGYKDFMTYVMLFMIIVAGGIYLFRFIRSEIKKDNFD